MLWDELANFAPATKRVWEEVGEARRTPVLESCPSWLVPSSNKPTDHDWGEFLNEKSRWGHSNRERILRYLITRSVVDQGSDIIGVEFWHGEVLRRLYREEGIPLLDDPTLMVSRYSDILRVADEERVRVTTIRAERWAAKAPNRKAANYWPFTVDGMKGKSDTHWFLTARVFPTIFLARMSEGGLEQHIFGRSNLETPKEMARRLRNDPTHRDGLGWVMGDKACDLFVKWAVGSFRLTEGLDCTWKPQDCPIPMDQRIGRIMMRSGFMDEFFGVVAEMSVKSHGFDPKTLYFKVRPEKDDLDLPMGDWFLMVMNFRREGKVWKSGRPDAYAWIERCVGKYGLGDVRENSGPQDVVSLLCRAYSEAHGRDLTPVEIDDYFMRVAGEVEGLNDEGSDCCRDRNPLCGSCPLTKICQANNVPSKARLKNYFT